MSSKWAYSENIKPSMITRMKRDEPAEGWHLDALVTWFCKTYPVLSWTIRLSELVTAAEIEGLLPRSQRITPSGA